MAVNARRERRRRLSGYTLTEMLVVLVIIGLISAVVVPQTLGQMNRAKSRTAKVQLQNVATALELFASDVGRYPTAQEGLAALITAPEGAQDWGGPYVREAMLKDPWGQPCLYETSTRDGNGFRVGTLGSDRRPGGKGAAQDVFVE